MGRRSKEPVLNVEITKQSLVCAMNTYLKEYRDSIHKALGCIYINETGGISIVGPEYFQKYIKKAQDAERYFQNTADRMRYYNNLEEN